MCCLRRSTYRVTVRLDGGGAGAVAPHFDRAVTGTADEVTIGQLRSKDKDKATITCCPPARAAALHSTALLPMPCLCKLLLRSCCTVAHVQSADRRHITDRDQMAMSFSGAAKPFC